MIEYDKIFCNLLTDFVEKWKIKRRAEALLFIILILLIYQKRLCALATSIRLLAHKHTEYRSSK